MNPCIWKGNARENVNGWKGQREMEEVMRQHQKRALARMKIWWLFHWYGIAKWLPLFFSKLDEKSKEKKHPKQNDKGN